MPGKLLECLADRAVDVCIIANSEQLYHKHALATSDGARAMLPLILSDGNLRETERIKCHCARAWAVQQLNHGPKPRAQCQTLEAPLAILSSPF